MRGLITWGELFTWLGIFLFVYYAAVLFLFYRKELSSLRHRNASVMEPGAFHEAAPSTTHEKDDTLYNSVLELMEDCKPVFTAAVQQQLSKEQIVASLQVRLKQYPSIRGTAFQVAVTNHIAQEMDHRLSMALSDDDAKEMWQL